MLPVHPVQRTHGARCGAVSQAPIYRIHYHGKETRKYARTREPSTYEEIGEEVYYDSRAPGRDKIASRIGQGVWRQCIHFAHSAFLGVVYFHPRFTVPLIGTNTWHRRSPRNERNDDLESRVRKESEQPFFRGVVVSSTMITAMSHSKQGIDYL